MSDGIFIRAAAWDSGLRHIGFPSRALRTFKPGGIIDPISRSPIWTWFTVIEPSGFSSKPTNTLLGLMSVEERKVLAQVETPHQGPLAYKPPCKIFCSCKSASPASASRSILFLSAPERFAFSASSKRSPVK